METKKVVMKPMKPGPEEQPNFCRALRGIIAHLAKPQDGSKDKPA